MKRIEIRPAWRFVDQDGGQLDPHLFTLLNALHETSKLTQAAVRAGMSYRHAWNTIGKWSDFFGSPLVNLEQGRGARLTSLGEKLLWAEARARARLAPQLENIASELNLEIKRALAQTNPTLRIHASFGYAVAEIPEVVRQQCRVALDLQYFAATDALASHARGGCDMAGFHVPEGALGARAVALYRRWLHPQEHKLIYLVRRQQGLYLKPGNPKHIASLSDLTRKGVRFINRQHGSGTRLMLDTLLEELRIAADTVDGYENEEFTHAAVAAYVASGMADVGLGVEPPAREFKLDFVPIAAERYFFICHAHTLEFPWVQDVLDLLRGSAFKERVARLPGYAHDRSGEVMDLNDAFPWLSETMNKPARAARKVRAGTRSQG
jgi:putative molybdopterin biosynthesis protein